MEKGAGDPVQRNIKAASTSGQESRLVNNELDQLAINELLFLSLVEGGRAKSDQ